MAHGIALHIIQPKRRRLPCPGWTSRRSSASRPAYCEDRKTQSPTNRNCAPGSSGYVD